MRGLVERIPGDVLLDLYRRMVLIRKFEERIHFLFLEGKMPGTIHLYMGQEAVAAGVCGNLEREDVTTSTHRPHGHAIARGISVESIMHELFGKATGCCRGRGGSLHIGDLDRGMVPAIAIVGGSVPVATGVALAFKMRGEPRVAVCFVGDGAVNEGDCPLVLLRLGHGVLHLGPHAGGPGVQRLGPVQRDRRDRVRDLVENLLVHGSSSGGLGRGRRGVGEA